MKKNSQRYRFTRPNPAIVGLFLIILITGYFLTKTFLVKKKIENLDKRLIEKRESDKNLDIKTVSPEQVFQWINKPNIQLIDIRNENEFNKKHIESSINIPLNKLKDNLDKFKKDKHLVIIDKKDSMEGKILVDHFSKEGLNIEYLKGGILKYAQENYSLINEGNINNPADLVKVKTFSAQKIKEELLRGKIFSFVDTRPEYLYNLDKIKGSFNFPLEKIENIKNKLPTHTLLLYDADPVRSWQAGVKLYDMGISNFYVSTDSYKQLKNILFAK